MNKPLSLAQDAVEIGARLTAARVARGLSIEQVADALLLSKTQARGLENGDVRTFYNAAFYRQALRKYAALVGVDADQAVADAPAPKPRVAAAVGEEPRSLVDGSAGTRSWRRPAVPMLAGFAALVIAAGIWLTVRGVGTDGRSVAENVAVSRTSPAIEPPPPPTSAPEPVVPPPAVERASTVAATSAVTATTEPPVRQELQESESYGSLEVRQSTWIFVRYANGEVVERSLAAGDAYVLTTPPVYLAVGTIETRLRVAGRDVDTTPWVSNGQLRLGAQAFASPALQPAVLLR